MLRRWTGPRQLFALKNGRIHCLMSFCSSEPSNTLWRLFFVEHRRLLLNNFELMFNANMVVLWECQSTNGVTETRRIRRHTRLFQRNRTHWTSKFFWFNRILAHSKWFHVIWSSARWKRIFDEFGIKLQIFEFLSGCENGTNSLKR